MIPDSMGNFGQFLSGRHSWKEWTTVLDDPVIANLMNDPELPRFKEFVKERHSQEEWEAFFAYVALPPKKRVWSQILGMIADIFHL